MLNSDGFWNFLSNIVFVVAIVIVIYKMREKAFAFFEKKDFTLKVAGNELTVQTATKQLGDYVTEIQARIASIETQLDGEKLTILSKNNVNLQNSNKRVLWVDDFPSNNAFIVEQLRSRNFEIDTSLSTADALKQFTAFDHNLIISDLGRIENDVENPLAGLDLIHAIRRINAIVPIVIFAGQRGVKMKDRLISDGASEVTSSGIDVMKYIERYMA